MFINLVIFGTLLAISSYSWLSMWIGLEINLLSIIPLMKSTKNKFNSEAVMKYFIAQTLASTILMFSIIINMNLNEFLPLNLNKFMFLIMNSSFLIKMGSAPFHSWFPEVMEGLNWMNCLLMLTWQKIAPMVLLMHHLNMTMFMSIIIVTSALIGSIMGLNLISLRKLLTYSSINHISWMLSSMMNFKFIWMIYFLVYSTITLNLIIILALFKIYYIKQFIQLFYNNKTLNLIFNMNFLSLGGLPPFIGFLPKWITIINLVENNYLTMSIMLILTTLITLFFYMRLTFTSFLLVKKENKFKNNWKINFTLIFINFLFLFSFPVFMSILTLS
uniref:NADH-ubiquinone oxidoreductase chain 2 n=1 Tax=Plateumaris sericea TaxID=225723 RepID=A0A3G1GSY0_PLASE|nr:NADH dehydrogenase subunit 2 [Plateumaris sericea]